MESSHCSSRILPIIQAILAALLFGASAPFAKILLGEVEPVTLAGLLYLGSGLALLLLFLVRRLFVRQFHNEAGLEKSDFKWLVGAVLAGGVAAPIMQLFGLRGTPGSTASLLLNFETVATTLIAALVFREHISKRAWRAILLITLASILLSLNLTGGWGISLGALGVLGACILWGGGQQLYPQYLRQGPADHCHGKRAGCRRVLANPGHAAREFTARGWYHPQSPAAGQP